MSKVRADEFVNSGGNGTPQLTYGASVPSGYTITGNVTGTASEASAAASGSALETSINAKATSSKSIALSIIFG
jgi:hypothetical protein